MKTLTASRNFIILFISLIIIPFAFGANMFNQFKAKSSSIAHYQVQVGNPTEYHVNYESMTCYLINDNGKIIIPFGGNIATGGGWGNGKQNSPRGEFPVPASFKIRWYSPFEDQFWQGEFKLPKQRMIELFNSLENNSFYGQVNNPKPDPDGNIIVNVTPGGMVVVWLNVGGWQVRLIGVYQAHKTDMDWDEFDKTTMGGYKQIRKEFVQYYRFGPDTPESIKKQIRNNTFSDLKPWQDLLLSYNWRTTINAPLKLLALRHWYANGERYHQSGEEAVQYQQAGAAKTFEFEVQSPDGSSVKYLMKLDPQTTIERFKQLGANGEPLELNIKFNADQSAASVWLISKYKKVELDINEFDLTDRLRPKTKTD